MLKLYILASTVMEIVLRLRLLTRVTPQWDVILVMIIILFVLTMLLMFQKLCGKPWESLKLIELNEIFSNLMIYLSPFV